MKSFIGEYGIEIRPEFPFRQLILYIILYQFKINLCVKIQRSRINFIQRSIRRIIKSIAPQKIFFAIRTQRMMQDTIPPIFTLLKAINSLEHFIDSSLFFLLRKSDDT